MGFRPSILWKAPELNPLNHKAQTIPVFNPINQYGRVFFFSWFSFFIAFWSWYAFPPLLSEVIAPDLGLTRNEVLNSNVIGLSATLLVRLICGPACDRFGPRYTYIGCMLFGAIPTFLAGTTYSVGQLYAVRFFVGVLGGTFVPCQVWTTAFFDKPIIGTANALTGGLGNSGGGVTYFVGPAVFESLVGNMGLTPHVAWRVTFVVPGILIVACALGMLFLCPDTPTGKWSERAVVTKTLEDVTEIRGRAMDGNDMSQNPTRAPSPSSPVLEKKNPHGSDASSQKSTEKRDPEAQLPDEKVMEAQVEVIQKPTFKQALRVQISPQTLVLGAAYFCSFGVELSVNSILGNYFRNNFPDLDLQTSGNYAAMFGLLNVVFRPLGGVVSDLAYKYTGSVWAKKMLLHGYIIAAGVCMVITGLHDPNTPAEMIGLINIVIAFFMAGANGLCFALVPHVHPQANGVVSGFAGAMGNFGGIVMAIIFRYTGAEYNRGIWIIGVVVLAVQALTIWIKPIPKSQR